MILLEFFLYLLVVTVIFSAVIGITAYMRFARQQPGAPRSAATDEQPTVADLQAQKSRD